MIHGSTRLLPHLPHTLAHFSVETRLVSLVRHKLAGHQSSDLELGQHLYKKKRKRTGGRYSIGLSWEGQIHYNTWELLNLIGHCSMSGCFRNRDRVREVLYLSHAEARVPQPVTKSGGGVTVLCTLLYLKHLHTYAIMCKMMNIKSSPHIQTGDFRLRSSCHCFWSSPPNFSRLSIPCLFIPRRSTPPPFKSLVSFSFPTFLRGPSLIVPVSSRER